MRTAFERLIERFPKDISVMDVGYGGLDGENTTDYLRAYFGTIDGICKEQEAVTRYKEAHPNNDEVIIGLYPENMPQKKYDLLVLDPNIESNLAFWSPEGMSKVCKFVKEGGYIITYIMATTEYGNEETQRKLAEHHFSWWSSLKWMEFEALEREERRPEILWVLLRS